MRTKSILAALALCLCCCGAGLAQNKKFTYKFYGQIRGDLFYNSRANGEIVDGLFHLYPMDHDYDPDGKDLNARMDGNFYVLYSRLGVDMTGPMLGKIRTSAKLEVDFRGSGSTFALLRIRHAYAQLAWKQSALLIGQTWHPLFGDVSPQMLNLSTGAPFNAFSRNPQVRYRFTSGRLMLTGAAVWQSQYLTMGPNGKSNEYIKHSGVPELYVSADYKNEGWTAGAGAELLSIVPRTESTVGDNTYKVGERLTSLSFEAHAKYVSDEWFVAAKSTLGSNLSHLCMLGGFGVTSRDARTGEQEYTPFRHSMTWLNVVHGKKWKQGLFIGYMKNLGTGKDIIDQYGVGLEVGQLVTVNAHVAYELPHWKFGVEYSPSTGWFGTADRRGKISDTHTVTNHRVLWVMLYRF